MPKKILLEHSHEPNLILLVDDQAAIREILAAFLEEAGFRAIQASDGLEALEFARSERPDLVISDVLMPLIDGYRLADRLHVEDGLENVPVILYSGTFDDASAIRLAGRFGVRRFLAHPISKRALLDAVGDALCGGARPSRISSEDLNGEHNEFLVEKLSEKVRELELSETRLKEAQEMAHVGNWVWNVPNNSVYRSSEIYRIFGLSPKEFDASFEGSLARVHPDDHDLVRHVISQAIVTHEMFSLDYRIIRPDGSLCVLHERGRVIVGAQGQVLRIDGVTQDITARKQAEEELRSSKQTIQAIFDAAPVAVFSLGMEGRIEHWSRGAEKILGWTSAEATGRVCPIVPKEGAADFREMISRVAGGGSESVVRILQKMSGERIHARLNVAPLRGRDGRASGIMVILEDVTERHAADEALRRSETRLANLIDIAVDAIISVDENQLIEIFNKGAESIFGYCASEILGQPLNFLLPERFWEAHARHMRAFGASPHWSQLMRSRNSVFGRRKDGSEFPAEASISKQRLDGRQIFTVILRDISDQERQQAAIQDYSERLRQLSRRLIDSQETERRRISRELHDQFGQSITLLEMNLRKAQTIQEPTRLSEVLEKSIDMLQRLHREVRDFALDLRPSVLDHLGIVPALRWHIDRLTRSSGLKCAFESNVEGRRYPIEIETTCFRIAQEAISNALRHSRAMNLRVSLSQCGGELTLQVTDDGDGFDPDEMGKLAMQGKSMGLLSMEERAKLSGGVLSIASKPGNGTTLCVRIPLVEITQSGEAPLVSEPNRS